MDLILGQPPAAAAAASAAEAANSASQAAASAVQAAAVSAASIGFGPGDSVIDGGGQLEIALSSIVKSANYTIANFHKVG